MAMLSILSLNYDYIIPQYGEALTIDAYLADGKYMAMGEHLSEAVISKSETHELWVKGVLAEKTVWTRSLSVAAGGMASASSL